MTVLDRALVAGDAGGVTGERRSARIRRCPPPLLVTQGTDEGLAATAGYDDVTGVGTRPPATASYSRPTG